MDVWNGADPSRQIAEIMIMCHSTRVLKENSASVRMSIREIATGNDAGRLASKFRQPVAVPTLYNAKSSRFSFACLCGGGAGERMQENESNSPSSIPMLSRKRIDVNWRSGGAASNKISLV